MHDLPVTQKRSMPRRAWVVLALASLAALVFLHEHARLSGRGGSGQTVIAQRSDFSGVFRLTGTTAARRSFAVLAPRLTGAQSRAPRLTKLVPSGTPVKAGDVLVEFDPQAHLKESMDKQIAYRDLDGQVVQKRSEVAVARGKDATALKVAEDEVKRTELEMGKNEILSRIDAEENDEAHEEAIATLKQLRQTDALKARAAAAAIRILEIQRDRAAETMRFAEANAKHLVIRSPMSGVAVLKPIFDGGRRRMVQTGDEVRSGVPFLEVVDPSQMDVVVDLNQADLRRVSPRQEARVQVAAFTDLSLHATLAYLDPWARGTEFGGEIRRLSARFSIEGGDPRLLPDLSAAVDLVGPTEKGVLILPSESVGEGSEGSYIWVEGLAGFHKQSVRLGPRNDVEVVVESGLRAGDRVRRPVEAPAIDP